MHDFDYDTDADLGNGSTSGAGTDNPANPTANPTASSSTGTDNPPPTASTGTNQNDIFSKARKLERSQYLDTIERAGLPIVRNDRGQRDFEATVKGLVELKNGATTAKPTATDEATAAQLKAMQDRVTAMEKERVTEREQATKLERNGKLATAFGSKLAEGALNPATEDFWREHEELTDDSGGTYYKCNGQVVLNSKFEPASLAEASEKFLERKSFYARATARTGIQSNGTPVNGSTQIIDSKGVMRVNPDDIINGKVRLSE